MKTFALAALAAFGLTLTAGTADAQIRYRSNNSYSTNRGSVIYSNPSYGSSAIYSYPSSSYSSLVPAYNPVVSSYYAPSYSTVVTPAGFSPAYSPSYYPSTYSGYSTYPSYYGGYSGTYVMPAGGVYRGRGSRW